MVKHIQAKYEKELELWLKNGWLVSYPEKELGPAKALILLMAVVQVNKNKLRPIMDYRELNRYIDMFTANADLCAQKLWEWRCEGSNVVILDLKKTYKSLWPFQTVLLKEQRYCLMPLGFGLNVGLMMWSIMN